MHEIHVMSETCSSTKKPSTTPLEMQTAQNSWRRYKNTVMFKLVKLWAKATVCVVVLPTILFVCFPLSIFLIPPVFIASTWAFCICKILYVLWLRVLDITMRFFRFCTALILGSSASATNKGGDEENVKMELIAKSLEDSNEEEEEQPMSEVELDPSEVPCFYESSDDQYEQEVIKQEHDDEQNLDSKKEQVAVKSDEIEQGWQVVVSKPRVVIPKRKKQEKHSFHEVLSYWKSKEKGEEAESAGRT